MTNDMRQSVYRWLAWSVVGCFFGCTSQPEKVTFDQERAHASVTLAMITADESIDVPSPIPTPAPEPGKCSNCGGDGTVGDFAQPCPVCGGDGIVSSGSSRHVPFWARNSELPQLLLVSREASIDDDKEAEQQKPVLASDNPEFNPDLVMYTADWCQPCTHWKLNELNRFLKSGKKVLIVEATSEHKKVPHFLIPQGDKVLEHSGTITLETFRRLTEGK